jgi:hypothetical protein
MALDELLSVKNNHISSIKSNEWRRGGSEDFFDQPAEK